MALCAYSFTKSGNNPEWILELTPREKAFLLASISWITEKEEQKNGNI